MNEADGIIRDGLTAFSRDPLLYVTRGVAQESRATLNRPNVRGAGTGGNSPRLTSAKLLDMAAADFRHALDLDPTLAIASLHLVTYAPRGVKHAGWHEMKVKLKTGGADITARPGYFVSESSPQP